MNFTEPISSYSTPQNYSRKFLDKMVLGSRFYFYYRIMMDIIHASNDSVDNVITKEQFCSQAADINKTVQDCGGRIIIDGLENIASAKGEPVVYIGNHMSLIETLMLPNYIIRASDRHVTFVIKDALLKYPFFGKILRSISAVAVGRANPRDDFKHVMQEAPKLLETGFSMVIFPQSTRSAAFDRSKFNTFGIKLAKSTGATVIPFALKTDFVKNGKLIKDLGPIDRRKTLHFSFDKPMKIEGNGKEQHNYIMDFIEGKLAEWNSADADRKS